MLFISTLYKLCFDHDLLLYPNLQCPNESTRNLKGREFSDDADIHLLRKLRHLRGHFRKCQAVQAEKKQGIFVFWSMKRICQACHMSP